jgi:alpha-tubulin suppressor-like RCC1 family protein
MLGGALSSTGLHAETIELPMPGGDIVYGGNDLSAATLVTTGAVIKNGHVYVWGFRGSGQQGNGVQNVASHAAPAKVQSLSNITQLTGGAYHLIALDTHGNVYGWGQNGYGETGCTGNYVSTPCRVMSNVHAIAAGEYFSVALDKDGNVWTWGHNLYGQLGDGTIKNGNTPKKVNLNGEKARLIGGAYEGAFAVTHQGHVWSWGDNEGSGLGFTGTPYGIQQIVKTPTRAPLLEPYANQMVYIGGGNGWGEALLKNSEVIGWGTRAALGVGAQTTAESSATPITIMDKVVNLIARYVGSFALSTEGNLYTWGQTSGSAFPMIYGHYTTLHWMATKPVAIGAGKEHLYYLTEHNELYGMGYNDLYKLDTHKCCAPNVEWNGVEIKVD